MTEIFCLENKNWEFWTLFVVKLKLLSVFKCIIYENWYKLINIKLKEFFMNENII